VLRMFRLYLLCISLMWLSGICFAGNEAGLVGYYRFDEGAGAVVRDQSGHGNDGTIIGGAQWVSGASGSVLELNGTDGYVEVPYSESLDISEAGTVEVWCRPNELQGGLVAWNTGSGYADLRIALTINNRYTGHTVTGCLSDGTHWVAFGKWYWPDSFDFGDLQVGQWAHLAVTFDGQRISLYRDGLALGSLPQGFAPDITDAPLRLGRCEGLGPAYFAGQIGAVRIYDQALSPQQILDSYREEAATRAVGLSHLASVRIEPTAYPLPQKIGAVLDARALFLSPGGTIRCALYQSGKSQPVQRKEISLVPEIGKAEVIFDAPDLSPGEYVVRASAHGPDGAPVGEESSAAVTLAERPPEFDGVKVLNNFVWELLRVQMSQESPSSSQYTFNNPLQGWVYIQTRARTEADGKVWVIVDSNSRSKAAITHAADEPDTLEAMMELPPGRHTVRVVGTGASTIEDLIVRRVPAIYLANYPQGNILTPFGQMDEELFWREVVRNTNSLIVGHVYAEDAAFYEQWEKMGRSVIYGDAVLWPDTHDEAGVDQVYQKWAGSPGAQHPLFDGILIDEFGVFDHPVYDVWRKAIERIYANPKFAGRIVNVYCLDLTGTERHKALARVVREGGGSFFIELYLYEQPREEMARHRIRDCFVENLKVWERHFPGSTQDIVVTLMLANEPNYSHNCNPGVNFKTFMDLQFQCLATHPACFGLGGVEEYHIGRSDEETTCWTGRLYRHYGIEGNTELLGADPYALNHIQNPDFTQGTAEWTLAPAEPGSIAVKRMIGLARIQGRSRLFGPGDSFLWTKRSAAQPNTFAQEIRDLEPGRLYSLKMITAGYENLSPDKSEKKPDAVSITVGNAEMISEPVTDFQFTYPSGRQDPRFLNYHYKVFRARGTSAQLTISDWATETEPGGPIGQELMFNFVEIQPYLDK